MKVGSPALGWTAASIVALVLMHTYPGRVAAAQLAKHSLAIWIEMAGSGVGKNGRLQ